MISGVKITGFSRLQRKLLQVTDEGRKTVKREIRRSALNIQREAKELVPVDTGRLRNSIATEISDDGLSAVIGTNVEYAEHVEHGTSRQRERPYLFPAFEGEWPEFKRRLEKEFREGVVEG